MCRQVVTRITDTIRSDLPRFLGVVHSLLLRPTVDKLTVLAAEILMLAHTHFSLPVEQVNVFTTPASVDGFSIFHLFQKYFLADE